MKVISIAAVVLVMACATQAKEAEVFTGYSVARSAGDVLKGWNGSLFISTNNGVGIVADVSRHSISSDVIAPIVSHVTAYRIGPKVAWRTRSGINPFVQATFGMARLNVAVGDDQIFKATVARNGLATSAGGGVDVRISTKVSVRVFQLEHSVWKFAGKPLGSMRASFGLTYDIGSDSE